MRRKLNIYFKTASLIIVNLKSCHFLGEYFFKTESRSTVFAQLMLFNCGCMLPGEAAKAEWLVSIKWSHIPVTVFVLTGLLAYSEAWFDCCLAKGALPTDTSSSFFRLTDTPSGTVPTDC